MTKLQFKAEDFSFMNEFVGIKEMLRRAEENHDQAAEVAKAAQKKFDEWLEKQSVVYGKKRFNEHSGEYQFADFDEIYHIKNSTFKARLVCIEPLEKKECVEHIPTVTSKQVSETDPGIALMLGCSVTCSKCGKQLKVAKWEAE